eukprot:TRINITY_DN4084_c0_g2_i1.p4 TRINITY_DN4084_c0_g2~~TRINITY_DN4084_c0_g2_i1.p4  ORF type:complete len:111 (+),score=35.25 TRINITY_DN4084_c0_g2_i1:438-770(+)
MLHKQKKSKSETEDPKASAEGKDRFGDLNAKSGVKDEQTKKSYFGKGQAKKKRRCKMVKEALPNFNEDISFPISKKRLPMSTLTCDIQKKYVNKLPVVSSPLFRFERVVS